MKVSIITTIYKAEKDLPRLLDSMMAQKSPELEFFLIDNGSPDRCGEICREYAQKDSRFKVFTLKNNIGYICARNLGIQEVDADYIGFCDSDDYLEPVGYDYAVDKIKKTQCDLYITAYNTVSDGNKVVCEIPYDVGVYSGKQVMNKILPQAFGPLPRKAVLHGFAWKQIFRRKIFLDNGLNFKSKIQPYEDQILNIEFINHCELICIDDVVIYNYVVNNDSITAKLAANFDGQKEWNRLVLFYSEKKCRATTDIQKEALSNQMNTFLYSLFLCAAKFKESTAMQLAKELDRYLDRAMIIQMLENTSKNNSLREKIVKWCLSHQEYRVLLTAMRLGLRLRG